MRYLILLTTITFFFFRATAQTETTTWNGKTYYVYPHQQEARVNEYMFLQYAEYKEVIKRDDKNRKIVRTDLAPVDLEKEIGFVPPKAQNTKEKKQIDKILKEVIQKKPELFYRFNSEEEQNITPSLEPIPDGDYVQYYRDLPYLDNNILRFRNDVVAAVFTIKNGVPDGPAAWYGMQNTLLKTGHFAQGSRTGEWIFRRYEPNQDQFPKGTGKKDDLAVIQYVLTHDFIMDTLVEVYHYQSGLRSGAYSRSFRGNVYEEGFYKNDKESGTWSNYRNKVTFDPVDSLWTETDDVILVQRYTYPEKKVRGKGVIIRGDVIHPDFRGYMYDMPYYDQEEEYDPSKDTLKLEDEYPFAHRVNFDDFGEFFDILENENDDKGLELPEEAVNSYEGEEYEGYDGMRYYDSEYEMDMDMGGYNRDEYYIKGKSYTRQELIDSIGYQFQYDGVYEEYFANGQLRFRFEVKDGNLVSEDTVFWSNGQAANTVWFDETTREYTQHFFDYNGKLYKTLLFDENGKKLTEEIEEERGIVIDGLRYISDYDMGNITMDYSNEEGMKKGLTERTLILATRWVRDSAIASTVYFDPATATRELTVYNVLGDVVLKETAVFGDDYENVSVTSTRMYGPLRLETISNGAKSEYYYDWRFTPADEDSAHPMFDAMYFYGRYDLTSDEILYYGDQPFTGKLNWLHDGSKLSIAAKESSITLKVPSDFNADRLTEKALEKYYKKGKRSPLLQWYTTDYVHFSLKGSMLDFFPFSYRIYSPHDQIYDYGYEEYYEEEYYDYEDYEKNRKKRNKKKKKEPKSIVPYDRTMAGSYLNGKPQGEWLVKDQYGELTTRANYVDGALEGEATYYATEFPLSESEVENRNQYIERYHVFIFDTPPMKKTQYISAKRNYKNDILSGPSVEFNWKGDTTSYDFYREGYKQGPSFERNKLFYSIANYDAGGIAGISRTYLTVPGQDSILIFDLNFQNGALQGQSTTYHTNGLPAKRGFFFHGQPIDDYEAFDTLGFRYQYVKFQYNQPVEEKIWEENQLSVRYLFDWKDSIDFDVSDIKGSSSFERLAYDLGLIRDPYTQPYYGRPSLVNKTGIDYTITKYYPNDTVAREGKISKGKKVGHWNYYGYEGKALYEIDYADTILVINDSIRYKSKGVLTYLDENRQPTSKSYIIEKIEKYDCSHSDHNEERMLYTFWERDPSMKRINGYVKNYYDNGALMNEGEVVNGIPTGIWKLYDSDGQLNQVGTYVMGKRDGRWLKGDLSNMKNMSEICLNPNLENLEEIMAYQEKLLDVSVIYYHIGSVVKREYYGINMNNGDAPEGMYEEGY